jgi:hypothetical protein
VVLTVMAIALWCLVPHETFARLATIPEQLQGGGLNQRWNIWGSGWDAFVQAPFFGYGVGCFVGASGLPLIDTAHNTVLSILVGGGLCALFLAMGILALVVHAALLTDGPLKLALFTVLAVWCFASLVATVEESRSTWLLLALIALAGRLAVEEPQRVAVCLSGGDNAQKYESTLAGQ